jgi:hypothetical protein
MYADISRLVACENTALPMAHCSRRTVAHALFDRCPAGD